jgi:hypothetical protein
LSVFWDEGRAALERFCREARQPPAPGSPPSPFNHFIRPDPDQLLRVSVALGFGRGRLKSIYQVLRGKDIGTGELSDGQREKQFAVLQEAQAHVLDLRDWHQFLSALIGAGFRSGEMISSNNTLLYAYAFYLIGRVRFAAPEYALQKAIGRWFFASSLTGRYTNSPETSMDADLARLRSIQDAEDFLKQLDDMIEADLTHDFWTISLPADLDSSSARNPQLFAYIAAQNRLGAPVLFSHKKISELIDPSLKTKRKALERHHLFPKAWLAQEGIDNQRLVNQMANYALLEWPENLDIRDKPPEVYAAEIRPRFSTEEWERMHKLHALPEHWPELSYSDFLDQRRRLMADMIRRGFESLR